MLSLAFCNRVCRSVVGRNPLRVSDRGRQRVRPSHAQAAALRDLHHRLEAALADVGRATAALAGAEARAEEAANDAAASRQDLGVAIAEGAAAERRLASVTTAAEVKFCAWRARGLAHRRALMLAMQVEGFGLPSDQEKDFMQVIGLDM